MNGFLNIKADTIMMVIYLKRKLNFIVIGSISYLKILEIFMS